MREDFDREWEEPSRRVVEGLKTWRPGHPTATLREIEAATDERLDRLRSRLVADSAMGERGGGLAGDSGGSPPGLSDLPGDVEGPGKPAAASGEPGPGRRGPGAAIGDLPGLRSRAFPP